MSEAIPHPRETFEWLGGPGPEAAVVSALDQGRMHHAWLLHGPRGVGKATFAYRAARRLLGAKPAPELGLLGSDPAHPVCQQVVARAHTDLLVLQRDSEDGKARRNILVGEARDLPEFFSLTAASAPYRVAIVDAVDDLNISAANALLKTLEEPPERGVLLLVCHSPGSLLPTIRSRCRRLRIEAADPVIAEPWLRQRAGVDANDASRLLDMARGAPGGAWRLAQEGALEADDAAAGVLAGLPGLEEKAVQALADSFRPPLGPQRFRLFFERLADRARAAACEHAARGEAAAADAWSRAWTDILDLARRTESVNLDRSDALFTTIARLRAIA